MSFSPARSSHYSPLQSPRHSPHQYRAGDLDLSGQQGGGGEGFRASASRSYSGYDREEAVSDTFFAILPPIKKHDAQLSSRYFTNYDYDHGVKIPLFGRVAIGAVPVKESITGFFSLKGRATCVAKGIQAIFYTAFETIENVVRLAFKTLQATFYMALNILTLGQFNDVENESRGDLGLNDKIQNALFSGVAPVLEWPSKVANLAVFTVRSVAGAVLHPALLLREIPTREY